MKVFFYKISILMILSIIFQSCANLKTLKSYYANDDLKISKEQLSRLSNYLNGELYSYELKRNVFAYPMAFLISENGDKSVVLACEGMIGECNSSIHIYQLIQKYNRKLEQNFKILALNKKILSKNTKAKIEENFSEIVKSNNKIFYDLILKPIDNCGGDDC